jgi:hypothetical protein
VYLLCDMIESFWGVCWSKQVPAAWSSYTILYYIILYYIYIWHAHIKSYQAIHDMTSHVWQTSPTCSNASGLISAWAGAAADIASQMLLIHSW